MLEIVPPEVRIANYEASLDGERLPQNLVARKQGMIDRYSDWVNDIVPREQQTRDIVELANEPLYTYPWYQAFLRQAYKDRFHGGPSQILITKNVWEERGLAPEVMQSIIDGPVMIDPN
jgi:hypothetical protein